MIDTLEESTGAKPMTGFLVFLTIMIGAAAALKKNKPKTTKKPPKTELQINPIPPQPQPQRPQVQRINAQEIENAIESEPEKKIDFGNARFVLKRKTILTEREIECYQRLVKSLSPNFLVFPQVAFSQILDAKGGSYKQNMWLHRTMSQKVADFLICKADLTMVAIIELDDSSHAGKEDKDRQRDSVVRQIGLLPLRLPRTPKQELLDRYAEILQKLHSPTNRESVTS
ncbi:DUF2726 domain-containing protein [Chromobacterium sp. ASV23]|uniref:DUF2726 domain-containing protein n=1 Tax=Chromobacterium sp. ASV23 TaxID=2795110 RepID=UPI0018EAC851|nr:DUF2726 domain-containing protein [Chromobacterium sp. ASV23]